MAQPKIRRSRNGARLPAEGIGPSYLGENIESDLQEVSVRTGGGTMQSRILVAAIALFAERGYENCNMRSLASSVGLKAPTLYNYYPSKEAVLVEAIRFGMEDFFTYVLHDIDQVPRADRLFEIIHRHSQYKLRHRLISRANDRLIDPQFARMFLSEDVAAQFAERMVSYRHRVQDLVADHIDADDPVSPMVVTLTILNQCDRVAYWYNPEGRFKQEEALQRIAALARRLLKLE